MSNYRVTLQQQFPYDQRVRAGVVVTKADGYEGELTDEQLKAIKADHELQVEELKEAKTQINGVEKRDGKPASAKN